MFLALKPYMATQYKLKNNISVFSQIPHAIM